MMLRLTGRTASSSGIRLKHETSFGQVPGELIAYELCQQESGDELESSCVCSLARALEFGLMIVCGSLGAHTP
jgi:hypothetical protein